MVSSDEDKGRNEVKENQEPVKKEESPQKSGRGNENPLLRYCDEIRIQSVEDLRAEHKKLRERHCSHSWAFRGQQDSSWGLKTSLERHYEFYLPSGLTSNKAHVESGLLRYFKRHFHLYSDDVPRKDDFMEWWTTMQHFGAPTRLLDWTYSIWVACFFAVETSQTEIAIWAIDINWLDGCARRQINAMGVDAGPLWVNDRNADNPEYFKKVFRNENPLPFVVNMNSYRLNERMVIQQGTFLCPGDVNESFQDNLIGMASPDDIREHLKIFTLANDKAIRQQFFLELQRMNMNRATLFPGLDGFAGSLKMFIAIPKILYPEPDF